MNTTLTGKEIRSIREQLGWTGSQLATALGVHQSTVFRWENADKDKIKAEPLQYALLSTLREQLTKASAKQKRLLSERLLDAQLRGGMLSAIHALLNPLFCSNDEAHAA
jgi:transcriptional regulator with XRE-family HTH domain